VTATSKNRLALAIVTALALASAAALAACGSSGSTDQADAADAAPPSNPAAFNWLHPSPPPHSWQVSRLPNGKAVLAYPADWRSTTSDPGTRTAAIRTPAGRIAGYLNATPQQGEESLSNWSTFRLDHNGDEGDTHIHLVAADTNLAFRQGHGSCVIDDYTSSSGHRYREIACIVAGAKATTVVVGAAPPGDWNSERPALEGSISAFKT
jgi:hypothetical protein